MIIHHSATIPETGKVPTDPRQVDQYHAARGMSITCFGRVYHVAYHFLIEPDGRVVQGRPERCAGAHARGYNSYLGISLVGDFSSADNPDGSRGPERPSAAQMGSLIELCRRLQTQYNIPLQRVLRHSDVSPTRCPGDRFPFAELLRRLQ
jgi:N-acetyl-anhydromuramyl-L-alanine amidase AmpD